MSPEQKLQRFLDSHSSPDGNFSIREHDEPTLISLFADTIQDDSKRDEFVIENFYSRYWNMLNNATFDSPYHKSQLFENLFEQKINDYKISIAMNFIQAKLGLSTTQLNQLSSQFTNQATQLALANDKKYLSNLADNLDNYLIDNFSDIFGFQPSNLKIND